MKIQRESRPLQTLKDGYYFVYHTPYHTATLNASMGQPSSQRKPNEQRDRLCFIFIFIFIVTQQQLQTTTI